MRKDILSAICLTGAIISTNSHSADLIGADPWQIIHTAREYGPADVGRDKLGDPEIAGEIDSIPYAVSFYGCWLGRECNSILFLAKFSRDDWEPDPDDIADWNAEKLFGRASLDGDTVVLDMAMPLTEGVPKATLDSLFEVWKTALGEFAEDIDFTE